MKSTKQVNEKNIKDEELDVIRSYYIRIWAYLIKDDYESATSILYDDMPVDLYDTSLDILYNRNEKIHDEELRHLICKVDDLLNQESLKELDLSEDNFNNQF